MEEITNTKEVSGGISADAVKTLKAGTILVAEGYLGQNQFLVRYLGEWNDPGTGYSLRLKVEVIKKICDLRFGTPFYNDSTGFLDLAQ